MRSEGVTSVNVLWRKHHRHEVPKEGAKKLMKN